MKTPVLLLNLAFLGAQLCANDWTVKLNQSHIESGGSMMIEVDPQGSGESALPIPEGGSEFTLWAIGMDENGHATWYEIDNQTVGAYLPTGTLTIETEDPEMHNGVPRTRIDRGFTVHYEVGGLQPGNPNAPEAAKKVLFDHNFAEYEEGHDVEDLTAETDFGQRDITQNGDDQIDFEAPNFPISDLSSDAGREIFRLYALPDGQVAQQQLAEAAVDIWPMATGSFSGVDKDSKYSVLPEVSVNLFNLYPNSNTYMVAYPGTDRVQAIKDGTLHTFTQDSYRSTYEVPVAKEMVVDTLASGVTIAGLWTLEVLTEVEAFGTTDSIASTTLNFSTQMVIRGSINALNEQ